MCFCWFFVRYRGKWIDEEYRQQDLVAPEGKPSTHWMVTVFQRKLTLSELI